MISVEIFKLHVLLLIPSSLSFLDSEGTLVKTIWTESDFTPICTNETSNVIMLIVCKIRTERNNGEQCSLLYKNGGDFVHECDSRFTLETRNQTVFLHLTSLTPADSGNYSCECSNLDGTYVLRLSITVNESFPNNNPADEVWSQSAVTLPSALTAAVLLIIIVSVTLGFIYRRRQHRSCLRSETSGSSVQGQAAAVDEDNSDELYSSLQQQTRDIYQTASFGHHQYKSETNVTAGLGNVEMNRNCNIYGNILN